MSTSITTKDTTSTSNFMSIETTSIPSKTPHDISTLNIGSINNDQAMLRVVYPMVISLLLLAIILLLIIVGIQCHLGVIKMKRNNTQEQQQEPQPYMIPVQTLPRENSIGKESYVYDTVI